MAQKITYWLLISLILALGFGQLLRFDFYGLPLYLHDILVVILLILLVLQGQALQVQRIHLRGMALLGVGLLLSSIRALTLYPLTSLLVPSLYLLRLLAYLVLFIVVKHSKILVSRVYFLTSGYIALIIGLSQYILMPDMRVFQSLGWDDHLSRLTLPHFDPTFTGVMLGLALLSNIQITRVWRLTSIVYLVGILLTYARSVWLSLAIAGLLFIKNKKVLLVSGILLLLSIFALPQKFGEGTNLLRTYSVSSRIEYDLSYVKKYKWDMLFGRGVNTLVVDQGITHATGPNNSYLYLLLTTGVLGLVGWGIFMWSIYLKSVHKPMLIFFFAVSLFNNVMFYPFALLWVLLLEAMVPTLVSES